MPPRAEELRAVDSREAEYTLEPHEGELRLLLARKTQGAPWRIVALTAVLGAPLLAQWGVRAATLVGTFAWFAAVLAALFATERAGAWAAGWCQGCHGARGRGDGVQGPMMHPPAMTSLVFQQAHTDAQIAASILRGKNLMPAFGGQLRPEAIPVLVKLVRAFGHAPGAPSANPAGRAVIRPGAVRRGRRGRLA